MRRRLKGGGSRADTARTRRPGELQTAINNVTENAANGTPARWASSRMAASAGGTLCSPPSLASLAPKGPSGSMLSTRVTAIGGDSTLVGMR